MTEDEELAALEAEMERVRALSAANMALKRGGETQDLTISLENVQPGDVQSMAMAAIPALLEKAYRLAMSDRASLESVLKCANMFMERALGKPKEHIEVKVSTDDEARRALEVLLDEGMISRDKAELFMGALGAPLPVIEVNDEGVL